jgi:hypothetical protein
MAQTGFTPILIYSSSTTTNAPAVGNLTNSALGSELAINITDGKLFYKDNANAIQVIAWKTTPTTAGGTGLTSYTAGDLLYYATGTTLSNLAIGAANTVLTSSGSAPQWSAALTITGLTDSGNLTFTGTGNRITGDFSNATHVNRVAFQTSTVNGATSPFLLPNGSGNTTQWVMASAADPTNSSYMSVGLITAGDARLNSGILGTGTYLPMTFYTGGSERVRIDTSGNSLFGTTSVPTNGASGAGAATFSNSINVNGIRSHSGTGGAYQTNNINFQWNGSATHLWVDTTDTGSITVVSDYRLKDKVETQTILALDRIIKLRPVTFEFKDYGSIFKADGIAREGFIAHELQTVIPSAVEGEKDAENQIQSLRLDALCSVMVKAIQEQQTLITSLTARIEALER